MSSFVNINVQNAADVKELSVFDSTNSFKTTITSLADSDYSLVLPANLTGGDNKYLKHTTSGTISLELPNTDEITEGSKLFFTDTRADDRITAQKGIANGLATLDGLGKIPASQINVTSLQYQGGWNANTNTPTLSDGSGTNAQFYVVTVAGSTSIDGNSTWNVGDWIVSNTTAWERVAGSQVTTVAGKTGAVTLDTDDVTEAGSLYYTEGRVDANANVAANSAHRVNTSNPHSVTAAQIGLGNVQDLKYNLAGAIPPTTTDDSGSGYSIGSIWIDVASDIVYTCVDASVGAAVWVTGASIDDVSSSTASTYSSTKIESLVSSARSDLGSTPFGGENPRYFGANSYGQNIFAKDDVADPDVGVTRTGAETDLTVFTRSVGTWRENGLTGQSIFTYDSTGAGISVGTWSRVVSNTTTAITAESNGIFASADLLVPSAWNPVDMLIARSGTDDFVQFNGATYDNEYVYLAKNSASNCVKLDPITGETTNITLAGIYGGAAAGINGMIYFCSLTSPNHGVYNPKTDTAYLINITESLGNHFAALSIGEHIYFLPSDDTGNLVKYKVSNATAIGTAHAVVGSNLFGGACHDGSRNAIYLAPLDTNQIARYNIDTNDFTYFTDPNGGGHGTAIYEPTERKVYFIPQKASVTPIPIVIFNPEDSTFETIALSAPYWDTSGVNEHWRGAALVGRLIYCAGYDNDYNMVIDTRAKTAHFYPHGQRNNSTAFGSVVFTGHYLFYGAAASHNHLRQIPLGFGNTSETTAGGLKISGEIAASSTKIYNSSGNSITINPNPSTTSHTWTLPGTQGSAGQVLTNDGLGGLSWGVGNPFNQDLNTSDTASLTGLEITSQGELKLYDVSGGQHLSIKAADPTTTHAWVLPATQGGAGTVFSNDGAGNLTWISNNPFDQSLNVGDNAEFKQILITDEGELRLQATSGVNYCGIRAPAAMDQYNLVVPATQGSAGQTLVNDGAGNLAWGVIGSDAQLNTFVGTNSGAAITAAAANNTLLGESAAVLLDTGDNNLIAGQGAAPLMTSGSDSIILGQGAAGAFTTGADTIIIGHNAGAALNTSTGNIIIGNEAAPNLTNTNNNICIGNGVNPAVGLTNTLIFGQGTTLSSSNHVRLGNSSIGFIDTEANGLTNLGSNVTKFADVHLTGMRIYPSAGENTLTTVFARAVGGSIHTLTFPNEQGGAGTVLANDGAGNLMWATGATTFDQNLNTTDGPSFINLSLTSNGYMRLYDADNSDYIEIKSAAIASTHTLTFPGSQGGAGTFLSNNGSGVLSWAAIGAITINAGDSGNTNAGDSAGAALAAGSVDNTMYGFQAGQLVSTGDNSTLIGKNAGAALTTNSNVTAVGKDAGLLATGGSSTFVGASAGATVTTGSNITCIGAGADASATLTNATAIGNGATVTASNTIMLGNSAVTSVQVDSDRAADLAQSTARLSTIYSSALNCSTLNADDNLHPSRFSSSANDKHVSITLSNGNLTATFTTSTNDRTVFCDTVFDSNVGTNEISFRYNSFTGARPGFGVSYYTGTTPGQHDVGVEAISYAQNGDYYKYGVAQASLPTFVAGDIIRLVVVSDTLTIYNNDKKILDAESMTNAATYRFFATDGDGQSSTAEAEILLYNRLVTDGSVEIDSAYLRGNTTGTISLRAADSTTDHQLFLPSALATTSGQVLSSTDAGITSWIDLPPSLTLDSGDSGNTQGGTSAGAALTAGSTDNTLYGFQAGQLVSTGDNSTLIGKNAGAALTTNSNVTAVGKDAGLLATGGSSTFVGVNAGATVTTGTNITCIGANADASAALTNATAIGNGATVNASNTIMFGNSAVTTLRVASNRSVDLSESATRLATAYLESLNCSTLDFDDDINNHLYSGAAGDKDSSITLSNGNLRATFTSDTSDRTVFTTKTFDSSVGTTEITFVFNSFSGARPAIGISYYSGISTGQHDIRAENISWAQNGDYYKYGVAQGDLVTFTSGNILRIVVENDTVSFYKDGVAALSSESITNSSIYRFFVTDGDNQASTAEVDIIPFRKIVINADTEINGGTYYNGDTSGSVFFKAADTTTNYECTWPNAQGGASTVLTNDGSGGLTWAAAGGSSNPDYSFVGTNSTTYGVTVQSVSLGTVNTSTTPDFYDLTSNHQNDALNGMTYAAGVTTTNASGGTKKYYLNGQISFQGVATVRFFVGFRINGVFQKNGAARVITRSVNEERSVSFSGIYEIDQNIEIKLSLAVIFSNNETLDIERYSYSVFEIGT